MTRIKLPLLTFFLLTLTSCTDVFQQRPGLTREAPLAAQQAVPMPPPANAKTIIGVLLPLSGTSKDVGRSALDAAKMAVFDLNAAHIIIKPYDTPGDANKAKANAHAVLNEGADIILGPLFSTDTRAITPIAQDADVPVLSLSNTPEIAKPNIYPLGYNPADQTRRVAEMLLSRGKQNFAVLSPNTRYAQLAVNALKSVLTTQGTLTREVYYDKSAKNFDQYIDQLTNNGTRVDFDALFIPEAGEKLQQLSQALQAKGLTADRVQFFGPDSWDAMNNDTCQVLRKGLYASPDKTEMEKFNQRFQSTYGYCPADIASIAYDMVALIAKLTKSGQKIQNHMLMNTQGFNGIDGPFRLHQDGRVERNYAVYEIDMNGPQTIMPPERAF